VNKYFNIRYEFDRAKVHEAIARQLSSQGSDYICVADGVILNIANRDKEYCQVINSGMFAICDSSYVPLYVKMIYGEELGQYSGSEIFIDIVSSRKYRMAFLGTSEATLNGLRSNLEKYNPDVKDMLFYELPYRTVDKFDYPEIAEMINADGAEIVWIALGAPKQEIFMSRLKPYLNHGVQIAVGAAFKFFSGVESRRAPAWMIRNHLEYVYRIYREPRKQIKRCAWIIFTLPSILFGEFRRKYRIKSQELV
jgi:N-acetylglucosaminyldiphosphoundecaprenol N-acetyl-beta-D-mannosaminyltransferase